MRAAHNKVVSFFSSKRFLCVAFATCFLLFNLAYCFIQNHGDKSSLFLGGAFALCFLLCYLFVTLPKTKSFFTENRVFLLILGVIGCFYMIVFPPFTVPDEQYHFTNAYQYSNLLFFTDLTYMRPEDELLLSTLSKRLSESLYESLFQNLSLIAQQSSNWEGFSLFNTPQDEWISLVGSAPQTRICSALGIFIGRLLHLGAIPTLYLGRLCNFAYYAFLVYWAVKIMPLGKRIFMVVALLPMTLHVASSYSYDAGTIGLAFLLIALLLKAIYATSTPSKRTFVMIIFLCVLLAPCKIVYTTLTFLVFLIPKRIFPSKRSSFSYKALVLCASLFSAILFHIPSLFVTGEGESAATNFYTFSDLVSNPPLFFAIVINTFNLWGDAWLKGLFGGSLGWFQVTQPWFTTFGFFILLLTTIPAHEKNRFEISGIQRLFFVAIPVISWFLIILVMYVGWTPNTEHTIHGIQGRYFLPLLPLMLLACKGKFFSSEELSGRSLALAAGVLNVAYVARMFATILNQ